MTNAPCTQLHFPGPALVPGYNPICSPLTSPLRWLHFGRLWLPSASAIWTHCTDGVEQTLVLLHGSAVVEVAGLGRYALGYRVDPFSAPPTMLYLPPDCEYRVTATTGGADLAVVAAPAIHSGEPLLFSPEQMRATRHGAGPWGRKIYMGITESPAPQRLMVGETFNRPGGWTSYPPHKHDAPNPPQEMPYEEVYFFLLKPAAGFALQRIYDPPECANRRDIALVVRNGDAVVIPRGYHPVIGTPGYQLYYLWMLCGDVGNRTYGQSTLDPDHAWLNQVEPLLEDPAHAH